MNSIRTLQRTITTAKFDAKLGQAVCWFFSALIMIGGMVKLTTLTITEPQFYMGLLLIVAVSMLGLVAGILLPIAQYVAEKKGATDLAFLQNLQQLLITKKCTRVADRAFPDGKSLGRNRVILDVRRRFERTEMNTRSRYTSRVRPTCLLLVGCFFASHAAASDPPKRRELFAQRGSIVPARLLHVTAGFPGRVTKVRVGVGDVVKASEVLAELDDTRAKLIAELAQAKVELARARYRAIEAGLAKTDRQQSPGKEMLGVAEEEIKTAEAELRLAKYDLEGTRIRAPSEGTVLARRLQVGDVVGSQQSNDSATALFDLADSRRLEVVVNVPKKEMSQVTQGQQCRIEVDALPKVVYQGKVVRLSPVAESATGSVRAYIEIELPEKGHRPLPGMTTSVGFLAKD